MATLNWIEMNCKCNSPPSSQRDKKSIIFDQCWFLAKNNFFRFRYGRYQNNHWLLNRANVKFGSTCLKFLEKSTIDFLTGAVFVAALTVLRVSRLCYYGDFSYTFTENLTSNFNQCGGSFPFIFLVDQAVISLEQLHAALMRRQILSSHL